MDTFLRLILLQDANTRVVLLGAALLGMTSGVIGSFAVLRRRALLGDALAHAALPGICTAYFVVGDKSFVAFLIGALIFGTLGVLCVSFVRTHTRIKEDAAIGIVLSSFFGLGIVLSRIIQNQPAGNRAGLDTYIYGKAALMVNQDVAMIALVAAVILIVVALLFKEFELLCFDRDFAAAQGWPAMRLDILLMALLCVCTVIGLPAVGVVLMAALLIIAAAAARFWTERLSLMVALAGLIGLLSGLIGTAASAMAARFAAGPPVVLAAAGFFVFSMLFAPRRGALANWWRRRKLRQRIALQNVLRALYEIGEAVGGHQRSVSFDQVLAARAWTAAGLTECLERADRAGLIRGRDDRYVLTEAGLREALRVVRAHRLWEIFLVEQAAIAPDHVDRDADQIEHVLPPELLARLEERLRQEGRLPAPIPQSPHPVGEVAP